ncbi:uncharacterized protein F4822DRAFT_425399 [Hypoxylon trugodes]|uniref:uncharacterized protein n=1 Tax=Hypoxylon trugodes TaxID=326681 RepID=UPI00219C823F|nr:uncharacterized protein F4822DRAFT_425399 [Hypoxylon trugodes]KAI1392188.1 hypothetical protein F4822DRAFT_425399 [Hypoxylon trugodes]
MSFADAASGLLRTLALWRTLLFAIGSTNRNNDIAGGVPVPSASSGPDAELIELRPWTATAITEPSASVPSIFSNSRERLTDTTTTNYPAADRSCDEIRTPELPRAAVIRRSGRETTPGPICYASSFSGDPESSASNSSRNLEGTTTKINGNDAARRRAVRKKQQASELCWREYWG